jgi:hypothetical protein
LKQIAKTVARIRYELLIDVPYPNTSDDVIFAVHMLRSGVPEVNRDGGGGDSFQEGSRA